MPPSAFTFRPRSLSGFPWPGTHWNLGHRWGNMHSCQTCGILIVLVCLNRCVCAHVCCIVLLAWQVDTGPGSTSELGVCLQVALCEAHKPGRAAV